MFREIIKSLLHIFIVICFVFSNTHSQSIPTYKIGTASKGGSYYPLGMSISELLKSEEFNLNVTETEGSVENIEKLTKGDLDFAIVQNDISFFAENGLFPFNKESTKLRGVITFYEEPIILVTNKAGIFSISQLANQRINVGKEGSGLSIDAKIILNSSGLLDLISSYNFEIIETKTILDNNKVDAAFLNTINDSLKSDILQKKIFPVSFTEELISSLTNTYPYFNSIVINIGNVKIKTLAVKSILVCREDIDNAIVYKVTKNLYEQFNELAFPQNKVLGHESALKSMSLNSWHSGAEKYYNEIGLQSSNFFLKIVWSILATLVLFTIFILIVNFFLFRTHSNFLNYISTNSKFLKVVKTVNLFIVRYKYLVVILIMITAYLTTMLLVQYIEHQWAIRNNVISIFDNKSFIRNLLWMFVFGGSGYSDNLFPNSPVGKFLVTLIPLIGLGGFITLVGLFTSDHIKSKILQAKGIKTTMIKNHIILCGWNENVPFLVSSMENAYLSHRKPIVILANASEEMPLEKFGITSELVTYVKGDATNRGDLDRANFKQAEVAIIIADQDSSDPDARNILKALTIEQYCKELELNGERKGKENIYTIVEISDVANAQLAYDAFVDEVISLGHIKSKILVQSVLNPGVSKFLTEILTYNELNEIYSIKISNRSKLVDQSFDELLLLLRKYKILLLSVSIGNHKSKSEVKKAMKKHGLSRSVLTNPFEEKEVSYKTNPGDVLIVLAQKEKMIDEALKIIDH